MQKQIFHITLLLLVSTGLFAQTSNEGVLYVNEDTQFSTVASFDNTATASFINDGEAFIYSNFNNDGIVDFYQNTGITKFVGTSFQAISGSEISYLFDVFFNNTSNAVPFQLFGGLNINGESNFYQGIVDNDNFGGSIMFNTNANHINTSDNSHVDGTVGKYGNEAFTFPIGDGGYYRFAGISGSINTNTLFEGKFYFENSNNQYSHELKAGVIEEIDNQEYWTIEKLNSDTENELITLSWRDVTTPSSMIEAAKQDALTIVRWDESTNMWVDEGGSIDLNNQTVTTAVNRSGVFTFGRVNSNLILPCELVIYNSVTANSDGKNDYFRIDQSNIDCATILNVQIFNRWGVKVFETDNYGASGNVFDGYSSGRLTVNSTEKLPSGTYYYVLQYQYGNEADNNIVKKAGYLYLSTN